MKLETWKSIPGFKGLYEVSDLGNVRSLKYGKVRVLKARDNGNGYCRVVLCKDGKMNHFSVHTLIFWTFNRPIPPGMTVDHINGDKLDNRPENLQLLSREDNTRKANNKQLDLIEADWPYSELTFPSSVKAGEFFNYKRKETVINYIYRARNLGRNWINIRGKKYYFSQEA